MKSTKIKAAGYSLNLFVLGLTGSSLIPADIQPKIAYVTLAILIVMSLYDLLKKPPTPKKVGKTKKVATKRRRPPRRRRGKRNK
jgi:hypothetical protein